MENGIKIETKLAKLILMLQIMQTCLSNRITSYFSEPYNTSTLIVDNDYDCKYQYGRNTAFEGVQAIIDHLIKDHKSNDGKLSKKPSTIIMNLNLYNSGGTNICYV